MRLLQRLVLLAAALWASGCTVVVGPVAAVADPHARLRPDVARGYARYHRALAHYGHWGPDPDFGVHWCPRRDLLDPSTVFRPYVSRGHWGISEGPIGRAPAGSPAWVSEDADTWGVTTMRHGWWIRVEDDDAPQQWCWVPGEEETPGRVVWRSGDGFVGWAPEEPDGYVDDEDVDDTLAWAYTLIGKLVDDATGDNLLSGDARRTAQKATAPSAPRGGDDKHAQRVGPQARTISDARAALARYAEVNQVSLSQAALRVTAEKASASARASEARAARSSASSASSEKSGTHTKTSAKEASARETSAALPAPPIPAAAYYDAMAAGPMPVQGDELPRVPRAIGGVEQERVASAGASSSSGRGASGGGGYASSGSSHAHRSSGSSGHAHTSSSRSSGHSHH